MIDKTEQDKRILCLKNISFEINKYLADRHSLNIDHSWTIYGLWCIYLTGTMLRICFDNTLLIERSKLTNFLGWVPMDLSGKLLRTLDNSQSFEFYFDSRSELLLTDTDYILSEKSRHIISMDIINSFESNARVFPPHVKSNLVFLLSKLIPHSLIFNPFSNFIYNPKEELNDYAIEADLYTLLSRVKSFDDPNKGYLKSHSFQQFGMMHYHPCDFYASHYGKIKYFNKGTIASFTRNKDKSFFPYRLIVSTYFNFFKNKVYAFKNLSSYLSIDTKNLVIVNYDLPSGQYPFDSTSYINHQHTELQKIAHELFNDGWSVYVKLRPHEQRSRFWDNYPYINQVYSWQNLPLFNNFYLIPSVSTIILEMALLCFPRFAILSGDYPHFRLSPSGKSLFSSKKVSNIVLYNALDGTKFIKNNFTKRLKFLSAAYFILIHTFRGKK